MTKRIGLFGGTFNPIHYGHLRAAVEVKEGFPLDECILVPAATPPHKTKRVVADAQHRLEMIRQAVAGHEGLLVSDVELRRSGPSYTVDTVNYFRSDPFMGVELFWILGLDAFLEIDTWKAYTQLLERISFIVISRPDYRHRTPKDHLLVMEDYLKSRLPAGYSFSSANRCYHHTKMKPIYMFDPIMLDISSTKIREKIRSGHSIDFLVPEKVNAYIRERGLYR